MRFPALRLPSFRLSFDWLEAVGGRRLLLYALYTAVLFAVFTVVNFPHNLLVQRALQTVDLKPYRLEVGDTRFAWWNGYELQRVRVGQGDPEAPPLFEASSLYVRPGFDGLLRGELKSVKVIGLLYGGEVDASWVGSGGMNRASFDIDRLQLQRYPWLNRWLGDGQVSGTVSGVVTVESRTGEAGETHAAGELDLEKASVADAKVGQFPVPPLHFERSSVKFSLADNRLEIQELQADGPELKVNASGQIALRQPLPDSVLNLKVSVAPGPASPDEVKAWLSLIPPAPKGSRPDAPRVVSGTIAKPRFR